MSATRRHRWWRVTFEDGSTRIVWSATPEAAGSHACRYGRVLRVEIDADYDPRDPALLDWEVGR